MKSSVWYGPAIREEKGMAYYHSVDIIEHHTTFRYALGDSVYLRSSSCINTSTIDPALISLLRIGEIKSFSQSKCDDQKQVEILWYLSPAQLREKEGRLTIDSKYDELRDIFLSEESSVQPILSIVKKCSIRFIFSDEENASEKDNGYSRISSNNKWDSSNNNHINQKSSSSINNDERSTENGIETNFDEMRVMNREHYDFICRYHYKNAGNMGGMELSTISRSRSRSRSSSGKSKKIEACDRNNMKQVENDADNMACDGDRVDRNTMLRDSGCEDTAATGGFSHLSSSDRQAKRRKHRDKGTNVNCPQLPIRSWEHRTTRMDDTTLPVSEPLLINAPCAISAPPSQVKDFLKAESIKTLAFKLHCDDIRFEVISLHFRLHFFHFLCNRLKCLPKAYYVISYYIIMPLWLLLCV